MVDLSYDCVSSKTILNFFVSERLEEEGDEGRMWSEALIIYGIHEYIAVLMNFGNIIGISRVSSNFYKVEMSKNKAFSSHIKSTILRF